MFSLQEGDADTLDRTAGAIRGRSARVCNVVSAEMDNYEPGPYTDRVMEAVVLLRDQGNFLFMNNRIQCNKCLCSYKAHWVLYRLFTLQ